MTDVLKTFADEIRSHDMAEAANVFEYWLQQARNDIHCKHTRNFIKSMEWIATRTDRTLAERVEKMVQLGEIKGPVVMSMALFCGWD
jgi:urocanate hydratase